MLVAAVALGALAALGGFSLGGPAVALGASVGTLAAGVYAWAFLKSHLSQSPRESVFDRRLATGAGLRLATAAVTGAAMFLAGRRAFVAYLAAFGAAFAVLLLAQAPRVLRQLQGLWLDEGTEVPGTAPRPGDARDSTGFHAPDGVDPRSQMEASG